MDTRTPCETNRQLKVKHPPEFLEGKRVRLVD